MNVQPGQVEPSHGGSVRATRAALPRAGRMPARGRYANADFWGGVAQVAEPGRQQREREAPNLIMALGREGKYPPDSGAQTPGNERKMR